LASEVLKRIYPAYLFDLDGTLIDTAPDINNALNVTLQSAGLTAVDESLTRHWVGHGSRMLLQQALTHHARTDLLADDVELARLLDCFIAHYTAHIADSGRPYPGVVETLDHLRGRGVRMAVVTNKLTALTHPVLAALNLHTYFDAIVCGDTLPQHKPDPAPALHACRSLGVAPADALFVGDSSTDVATARNAGCPVVAVRDGYNHGTPAEALGADAVIVSFTELLRGEPNAPGRTERSGAS
jgi:phosphoglycolate phosphatase